MDQELNKLITKAKQGHQEAFALLLKRFKGHVYRYAYGMLGDRLEAEDVTQETFIKAYYSLSKLESEFAFTSWLTRIASHLCYDRLQRRKKESIITSTSLDEHEQHGSPTEGAIEQKQLRLTIEEAMAKLSPEHREAIILRDVQGYAYDEIASMLNIPSGTVKSRINAARAALRKEIDRS